MITPEHCAEANPLVKALKRATRDMLAALQDGDEAAYERALQFFDDVLDTDWRLQ